MKSIHQELENARLAREQGFEGRARVCARRAAGLAIKDYLTRSRHPAPPAAAYDLIMELRKINLSEEVNQACDHLLIRVNEEFNLPSGIDLIEEARRLVASLEND